METGMSQVSYQQSRESRQPAGVQQYFRKGVVSSYEDGEYHRWIQGLRYLPT
jgi:hypothetical protein